MRRVEPNWQGCGLLHYRHFVACRFEPCTLLQLSFHELRVFVDALQDPHIFLRRFPGA